MQAVKRTTIVPKGPGSEVPLATKISNSEQPPGFGPNATGLFPKLPFKLPDCGAPCTVFKPAKNPMTIVYFIMNEYCCAIRGIKKEKDTFWDDER